MLDLPASDEAAQMVSAMPFPVMLFDGGERLVYANPAACGLFSFAFDLLSTGAEAERLAAAIGSWLGEPENGAERLLAVLRTAPAELDCASTAERFHVRTAVLADRSMTERRMMVWGRGCALPAVERTIGPEAPPSLRDLLAGLSGLATDRLRIDRLASILRAVLEGISEAVAAVDLEANLIACNGRYIDLLGIDESRLVVGQSLDFALDAAHDRFADFGQFTTLGTAIARDPERPVDGRIDWHDGRVFSVMIHPLRIGGVTVGRVWGWFDVTRLDTALRSAQTALAEARQADAAKTSFLATMSHEIRTPLNGMIGMLDLMDETEVSDDQRRYLEAARESSFTLLRIVNDILDYSKFEAGRVTLDAVAFSPRLEADTVAALLEPQAAAKGIHLGVAGPHEETIRLIGDPVRFRQLLLNLVGNAVKFTERGEVTVILEARRLDGGLADVTVSVRDTGIGIEAEVQDKLFNRFVQADSSTTRRFGGSGLGLAICRQILALMGGRIDVASTPGQGSTFRFQIRLPVAEPVGCGTAPSAAREPGGGRRLRVLVAEDHPVNQMVIGSLLTNCGHEVVMAVDGREAVEAVATGRLDLVLMDVHMPEVDGIEATRRIRALPGERGGIFIVACTADAMTGDRERFLAAGMDDYLSKPIKKATLREVLERALQRLGTRCEP